MAVNKYNTVDIVADNYRRGGWIVIVPPKESLNDIIAQNGSKFHFVQVVDDPSRLKFNTLSQNSFIQNAFSNGARPVYARVSQKKNKKTQEINYIVLFEDVNLASRVIIARKNNNVNKISSNSAIDDAA